MIRVKIVNEAKSPWALELDCKKLIGLNKSELKANMSACGEFEFRDLAEAMNHVLARACTRRYEIDLYEDPCIITILDGPVD